METKSTTKQRLKDRFEEAFSPVHLSVIDDSHHHAGHATAPEGGDSHFTVIIASNAFDKLTRVDRQRAVMAVLSDEFSNRLHALSLQVFTAEEWMKKA